jgi:hypothetical protein
MKNQIKFPLTLDSYLNPSLGKQDKVFGQDQVQYLSVKEDAQFGDLQSPLTNDGQANSRKKSNPRLRIL